MTLNPVRPFRTKYSPNWPIVNVKNLLMNYMEWFLLHLMVFKMLASILLEILRSYPFPAPCFQMGYIGNIRVKISPSMLNLLLYSISKNTLCYISYIMNDTKSYQDLTQGLCQGFELMGSKLPWEKYLIYLNLGNKSFRIRISSLCWILSKLMVRQPFSKNWRVRFKPCQRSPWVPCTFQVGLNE